MNLKRKITISPEKRKKKGALITENVPLRFRVTIDGNRVDLFSGFRIDLDDWDKTKSKVKENRINKAGQNANEINISLNNYENDLNRFFLKCVSEEKAPTVDEVKEEFKGILETYNPGRIKPNEPETEEVKLTFFEVLDEFMTITGRINSWSLNTTKKFEALKNHLFAYNPNLQFEDLTQDGLVDVLNYFIKTLKLRNSTTKKYIKFLSYFLRYSLKNGYTNNNAILQFKPKLKNVNKKIIFFTEEELLEIRKLKFSDKNSHLEKVRDVLLFLCYSGLRFSDVYELKRPQIKEDRIEITTQKTSDNLVIELNSTTKAILDKYKDETYPFDKALPVITNQKMNRYVKDVAELAKINESINESYFIGSKRYDITQPKHELVTTHIGRRTFICLCIAKGIPVQVVMKWTGHSDYKSMKPYIEIAGKTKELEMQKLNF